MHLNLTINATGLDEVAAKRNHLFVGPKKQWRVQTTRELFPPDGVPDTAL
jgi:hypothetical protein